jgi:predicted DNA-binding transcriptional regulator
MDATTKAAVEHLQALGFNESDALAYTTLVQRGPMTGYQLAKESGIPRPNIYAVIDRLEKRGALTRIGVGEGVKYGALPAEELLTRLASGIGDHLSAARKAFEHLGGGAAGDYVWNVEGYPNVLSRAGAVIRAAKERILVGNWSDESARLDGEVRDAEARGVNVVTLCVQGCATECGKCHGQVYRIPVAGDAVERWLIVVGDDREAVMGEVAPGGNARAAHTTLPVLVAIAAQYVRNTIASAEIVRSLGRRLPQLLDREAARTLSGPALAAPGRGSWLTQLLGAVRRRRS